MAPTFPAKTGLGKITIANPHIKIGPTLIGGAGRSGKTLLAGALFKASGPIFGFPLEAVFHVYQKRLFPFFSHQLRRVVREYTDRPRYIDSTRINTQTPQDFINERGVKLLNQVPKQINNQVSLLGWILDQISLSQDKETWAAFDLHPEFRYGSYRTKINGLRLAVMTRQPESAVAAAMYWRTWPKPPIDRRRRFLNVLGLVSLSQRVTSHLSKQYPADVISLSLDSLCEGNSQELSRASHFFRTDINEISRHFAFTPHFRFDESQGFYTPAGTWQHLLTSRELRTVELVKLGHPQSVYLRSFTSVGWRKPVTFRALTDLYLYPKQTILRQGNTARQILTDAAHGFRLKRKAILPSSKSVAQHFFVISGAHGVGKSTCLAIALEKLQEQEMDVTSFHHRIDKKIKTAPNEERKAKHALLKVVWRLLPLGIRGLIVALVDEYFYATSIFKKLFYTSEYHKIALGDRYIYDRLTDLQVRRRPWYQIWAVSAFCRLMPHPAMTFMLFDKPNNIYSRKQELTENEIERYQTLLLQTTKENGAPFKVIHVGQKNADTIGQEITIAILEFINNKKSENCD